MQYKKFLRPVILTCALAVALSSHFVCAQSNESSTTINPQVNTVVGLPDFTKLVEDNGKAVVSIDTVRKAKRIEGHRGLPEDQLEMLKRFGFPFPFGGDGFGGRVPERRGQGSGFIISPDGYILTNHHVIDGADEVTVHLNDKKEFKAKVIGSDQKTDVAVLKIDAKKLPTVKLGKSEDVKVGEWVAAIGAPFGLDNTVTAGIVSAKSRNLPDDQFVPFIQTDVAVNPGNSGGPLFNMKGEVIGINSQIFSTSGGFMGLSFAIPIDIVVQIKDQLIKEGKVSRGRIGVMMQQMTPELAKSFGVKSDKGALIAQIEKDGPADKGGLKEGDIIIEFNGKPIEEINILSREVANTKPGTKAKIKVIREGKEKVLDIVVEELPLEGIKNFRANTKTFQKDRLGLTLRELNSQEKKRVKEGLVVEKATGAAAEAGIRPGDIIVGAAGKKVKNKEELSKAVDKAGSSIALLVERDGSRIFVPVKLPKNK